MAVEEQLVDADVVDERLEVLLHDPVLVGLDEFGRRQRRAGHRHDGRAGHRAHGTGGYRSAVGYEPVGVGVALHVGELVTDGEAVADVEFGAAAAHHAVPAPPVGKIVDLGVAGQIRLNLAEAGRVAELGEVAEIEAGIERHRQHPLAMIIGQPGEEIDLAGIEFAGEVDRELLALFGLELGVADAGRGGDVSADHVIEVLRELAAQPTVQPLQVVIRRRVLDASFGLLAAFPEIEIDGQSRLALAEDRIGAAAQTLDARDRLVDAEDRALLEERQHLGAVQRRAVDGERDEGRVAAARQAADVDVRPGDACRALGPDARNRLEQVSRALRRDLSDVLRGHRRHCEARFLPVRAAATRRTGHHDLLEWLPLRSRGRLLGRRRQRHERCQP